MIFFSKLTSEKHIHKCRNQAEQILDLHRKLQKHRNKHWDDEAAKRPCEMINFTMMIIR